MLSEPRLYEIIGENIRRIREHQPTGKMTQGALADAVGMERTSISNIEKGAQKVSVVTLYQIAEAMQVTLADLLPKEIQRPTASLPRVTPASPSSIVSDVRARLEQFPLAARATVELLGKGF